MRLCKEAAVRVSFIPLILLVLKMHTRVDRIIRYQLDLTQWSLAVVVAVVALAVSESIVAAVKNANVTLLPELVVVVEIIAKSASVDHDHTRALVE